MDFQQKLKAAKVLARTKPDSVGFSMPPMPQIGGRLAQIDPDGTNAFNDAARRWGEELITKLAQAMSFARSENDNVESS